MNTSNTSNIITFSEWNDEITTSLIPNIIVLSVYLVLGICGNFIVLLVYAFQIKRPSDERYFIPVLAAFDMIATLYLTVNYIFQCLNQVTFSNDFVCKILAFCTGLTTFNPISILVIIAVQRYMKICFPFKQSMSILMKRSSLVFTNVISLLYAIPLPFVYGSVHYRSVKYGISGTRCGRLKEGHPFMSNLHAIVACVLVFVVVITLTILYGRIGYTVFHNLEMKKRFTRDEKNIETNSEGVSTEVRDDDITTTTDKTSNLSPDKYDGQRPMETNEKTTASKRRRKHNRRVSHKLTIMFLVITVVFLFCFLPKVTILLLEGMYANFWEQLSILQRPVVMFLYNMFIINNIVNPIIYAFMDIKFRNEAAILLKRMFRKPCICCRRSKL
ncbi:CCKAR [Mytilus coruscus]|uniref:CCKAR n=1 Tax=Mytilus coruscus TaxID=42192 RepID=A0A6J8CQT0_MYTCO|nr:CCKAR [Mytilus coruscus]